MSVPTWVCAVGNNNIPVRTYYLIDKCQENYLLTLNSFVYNNADSIINCKFVVLKLLFTYLQLKINIMISRKQKTLFANLVSFVHSQDNSSMNVLIDSRGTIILYCNYFTPEVVNKIQKLIGSRYYNIRYYQKFDHMLVCFCILDED